MEAEAIDPNEDPALVLLREQLEREDFWIAQNEHLVREHMRNYVQAEQMVRESHLRRESIARAITRLEAISAGDVSGGAPANDESLREAREHDPAV